MKKSISEKKDMIFNMAEISLSPNQIQGKSSLGHETDFILDGSSETFYQTPEVSSSLDYLRFVDIDLQGLYQITAMQLYMIDQGYNHYQIYASETGEHYRKIGSKSDDRVPDMENGDIHIFEMPVTAAYLRINLSYNSAGMQGNLSGIKVFGNKIGDFEKTKRRDIHVQDFVETAWKEEWDRFENDAAYAREKILREMRNMVARVLGGEWTDRFVFDLIIADRDTYEIENGSDGRILIRGTNGISMASGLHFYLRYFCKVDYNPFFVSQMRMPDTLPAVPERIVKETPYDIRYGFHACAHSYTMPFWEWDKYEACLDWAAMSGINLMLHMVGQEEILRRTLVQFGYSDAEVKEYIPAPTYFTWGCRNMFGFGGPLPDNWFADRVELGRKIHDRMQVFGMKPVLRGYYGAVPTNFVEKNPEAKVIHQGLWCQFTRPDTLCAYVDDGCRDLYQEVADAFYTAQKAIYGDVTNYFIADPFMEGGRGDTIDQARMFRTIHSKMLQHNPNSIWVIQSWEESIDNAMLEGLVCKENVLVLDIQSEIRLHSNLTEKNQLPWIWGLLHEFGGKLGMEANAPAVSSIPLVRENSRYMVGMGMTSESLNRCPMIYEMLWDMAWVREPIDLMDWGKQYLERRYGDMDEELAEAWSILLQTVYSCEESDIAESLIHARPTERYVSTNSFGRSNITYDVEALEKAFKIWIDHYDQFKDRACYRYDLVDMARQVLSNASLQFHKCMMNAYYDRSLEQFTYYSTRFLHLIRLQDDVLDTSDYFQTGTWLASARNMTSAQDDWTKDMLEWNARCLITTWGGKRTAEEGGLRDYSYRAWAGITKDYYYKRWAMWIENYKMALEENREPAQIEWFLEDWKWANRKSDEGFSYPTRSTSHKALLALVREIYDHYTITNFFGTECETCNTGLRNLLLGKRLVTHNHISDKDLFCLTDGNSSTGWIGTVEDWPLVFEYEFDGQSVFTEELRITFKPLVASGIAVAYKVEIFHDDQWHVWKEDTSENIPGQISIICKERINKIRLTFDSRQKKIAPELRHIELIGKTD